MNRIGGVSDSSVLIFNKVPFIDISYPVPHIPVEAGTKMSLSTSTDTIKNGLNFYSNIASVSMKSNDMYITKTEEDELVAILKGGVIYNGSWS